ncbi:DUF4145 domain-containing protein [Variovorax sp. LT2P21]|uniref:DUF4145 domain-containing protein n=1 Tax=Variovorax sp. LT2P21 TaxID=3443731 RepID=UPI003F47A8EC
MDLLCDATEKAQAIQLKATLIECPSQSCKAQSLELRLRFGENKRDDRGYTRVHPELSRKVGVGDLRILPTTPQPLSSHVPAHVLNDYDEAYLIAGLSPKASATLARRALQGMVRDFFTLPKLKTLHQELEAIKDKCDPDLYAAMMDVKSVGNIGAHPEQDVSLIVDVEPGEPETLLKLIHLLDREWYVARADKQARIANVRLLAAAKKPPAAPAS